jgi:outer membrane protein
MMPSLYAFGTYGSAYNYQHDVPDSIPNYTTTQSIVTDPSVSSGYSILNTTGVSQVYNSEVPRPFSEQFRKNNTFKQYGVQLTIPLFNGFQNRAAYVQQKVLYDNSQLTRKNLEFQIRNDIVRAVRTYDGAKKAFAVTVDQLKAAELAFSYETERYNLGVTNFVDYTNANRVLVQAQTDKAQAEYRLVFQKILLEYAAGTLKPENIQAK